MNVKKDFGTVYLEQNIKQDQFDYYGAIRSFMDSNGYNVESCDICSTSTEWIDNKVDVKFKFVHYSVPTMSTEPYYLISFIEA